MARNLSPPATRAPTPLGPGGRPFAGWRPLAALSSVGWMLVAAIVLVSDRAPGLLRRLSDRIDVGSSRTAELAAQARPESDFEIHVYLWAAVALFVGLASWSNRSLLVSAIGVFALSVVAERAQDALSHTRDAQFGDLVANLVGVLAGLGLVCGLAILMGWRDAPPPRSRARRSGA